MFFPEKITSIKESDKVLEIGPGATPHPRSDVFLEIIYDNEEERIAQSGNVGILNTTKQIIYYNGEKFPFVDKEFDYIICSHVLEHVQNIPLFISEIQRVSSRGYFEFPTIYYDYLYNIPEHINFLLFSEGEIKWIKKETSGLLEYSKIQEFFYVTLNKNYHDFINQLKVYFFHGFEWNGEIKIAEVKNIEEILFSSDYTQLIPDFNLNSINKLKKYTFLGKIKLAFRKIILTK